MIEFIRWLIHLTVWRPNATEWFRRTFAWAHLHRHWFYRFQLDGWILVWCPQWVPTPTCMSQQRSSSKMKRLVYLKKKQCIQWRTPWNIPWEIHASWMETFGREIAPKKINMILSWLLTFFHCVFIRKTLMNGKVSGGYFCKFDVFVTLR